MRVKHKQGPVDDLVRHADVEQLRLLLRLAAPDRCLLQRSGWDDAHGGGSHWLHEQRESGLRRHRSVLVQWDD